MTSVVATGSVPRLRILVANDGFGDAGGVQSYLDATIHGLRGRGHEIAIVHNRREPGPFAAAATQSLPQFSTAGAGIAETLDRIRAWAPDVCFSHNMNNLALEGGLADLVPIVKFMHGYAGTCIGGLKRHGFPVPRPCDRVFGPACLALYMPCRCGHLDPAKMIRHYRWAVAQRALFPRYRAIVVASDHMKREYVRHGVDAARVHVNPLFPTDEVVSADAKLTPHDPAVAFVGRMTTLKGGELLIRAVESASRQLGRPVRLIMIGDGPQRSRWAALGARLKVPCSFTGWLTGDARWTALAEASVLAVSSTWPEPFGLVGLEAAALGVPAIAFDVGGIRQWLRPGENGVLVPGNPPRAPALAAGLVNLFGRPGALGDMRRGALAVAREMSLARHLGRLEQILAPAASQHADSAGR